MKEEKKNKKEIKFSKRKLTVALAIEAIVLIAICMVFLEYSKVAPQTPVRRIGSSESDVVFSGNGKLKYNNVEVKVPEEENTRFTIAYSWGNDDSDYPTIPRAAVASYISPNTEKTENSGEAQEDAPEDASEDALYEISLFKDSYYGNSEIPAEKNAENWFSDWKEEDSDGLVKKKVKVGETEGFLISTLDSKQYLDEYKSYRLSFAVSEIDGISIYTIEGICYDLESINAFKTAMESASNSIAVK